MSNLDRGRLWHRHHSGDAQVHFADDFSALAFFGLADKADAESGKWVRTALPSIRSAFPPKRSTINLAPAAVSISAIWCVATAWDITEERDLEVPMDATFDISGDGGALL